MSMMCPQCGFEIVEFNLELCPKCGFDFNSYIDCPHKISNRCVHSGLKCDVAGLNYEICKVFMHKCGLDKRKGS